MEELTEDTMQMTKKMKKGKETDRVLPHPFDRNAIKIQQREWTEEHNLKNIEENVPELKEWILRLSVLTEYLVQ